MKQQVVVAMALLSDAKYLLLDEPMNGLDPSNRMIVSRLISDFANKGGAVILSSHMLEALDLIDTRTLFLKDGVIIREIVAGECSESILDSYQDLFVGEVQ